MIANPNGSAMRPLAIGGLRAQSKSGDLPRSIGMITCLHGSRVEAELHELFIFVSRDSIDSLDGVDREDDPRAFPRERSMESRLGVEDDDVPIEINVRPGDRPAVYIANVLPERVLDPESATLEVTELDDHVGGGVIARVTMGFRLLIIEDGERREHGLRHHVPDVLGDRLNRPRPRTARGSQTSDAAVPIGTSEESAASLARCFMLPLIRQVEGELHDLFTQDRRLLGDELLSDRLRVHIAHHPRKSEVRSEVRSRRARSVVADHGVRLAADHAQVLKPAIIPPSDELK